MKRCECTEKQTKNKKINQINITSVFLYKFRVHHALTAGNAFLLVDYRSFLGIAFNRIHAAGCRTGSHLITDCIIGADSLAFTASDTFFRIDKLKSEKM